MQPNPIFTTILWETDTKHAVYETGAGMVDQACFPKPQPTMIEAKAEDIVQPHEKMRANWPHRNAKPINEGTGPMPVTGLR